MVGSQDILQRDVVTAREGFDGFAMLEGVVLRSKCVPACGARKKK